MSRAEATPPTAPAVLDYTAIAEVRPWPVHVLAGQLLTPVFTAALARIISNHLHRQWGPGYPNRAQILDHLRFAEDVPFFAGAGLLLLITAVGIVHGVRGKSRWLPVVVGATIAFVGWLFAIMIAVPYY
jgi:hypothetical protein